MASSLERRRFSRLIIPLEVQYQTQCPLHGEMHQGQGVLRDISLSGSFFHVDHPVDFKTGQIISLSIAAPLPFLDDGHTSRFTAQGEVVRLEPPGPTNPNYGIALNFLHDLSFAAA